jgi:ligand-binding sensor domain-containing protein
VHVAVIAVLLSATPAAAQRGVLRDQPAPDRPPRLRFERITNEDGLALNLVRAMLQDSRGFVWFGTEDGLSRYDGYGFVDYQAVPFDPNALRDDNVTALAEGPHGAIWVGTSSGLSRLDPQTGRFHNYAGRSNGVRGLPAGRITSLLAEPSGVVWIGLFDGGLVRFDTRANRYQRFGHDPADRRSLSSNMVRALFRDGEGSLWVGTANGLNRLDPLTETSFRRYQYDPAGLGPNETTSLDTAPEAVRSHFVLAICGDPGRNGVIWAGTGAGVVRLDVVTGAVSRFMPDASRPHANVVTALVPDPAASGVLWVASRDGLHRLTTGTGRFTAYRHDGGSPTSIGGDALRGLMVDRTGLIWVQTNVEGISRFDPAGTAFFHGRYAAAGGPAPGSGVSVRGMAEDAAGRVWFTSGGRIALLDRAAGTYSLFRDSRAPSDLVDDFNLYQDRAGTLWVGGTRTVYRIVPSATRGGPAARDFTSIALEPGAPLRPIAFYHDREDAIWAGGVNGIGRLDPTRGSFRPLVLRAADGKHLDAPTVFAMTEDATGRFWAATGSGLLLVDRATGTATAFRHDPVDPTSLGTDGVYAVHERAREPGVLWLGTTNGLYRFDTSTGRATRFGPSEGLPNTTIYAVVEDDRGHLWLSTNDGLSDFDPGQRTFLNYGPGDGLQSREFNLGGAYRSPRTGELFFGGINGFSAFFPGRIPRNPHPPTVVLTGLRVGNRPVTVSDDGPLREPIEEAGEIRLRPSEKTVTFEFVALHYQNPPGNRYAYRLDGFDAGWVDARSERTATYTNLDPGSYTFRVRAASSDGVWNEEGAAISLVVLPAWWQTAWARLGALLGLVGLAAASVRVRVMRRRADEALRFRIATDLHDEMGGSLSQVSLYSELIRRTAEGTAGETPGRGGGDGALDEESARIAAWAAEVGEHARSLSGSMRDAVWAIRPQEGGWDDLELRLKDVAVTLLAPRGVSVSLEGEAVGRPPVLSPTVRQHVLLFFKEAIHNAARHADARHVQVRWTVSGQVLRLRVSDDGRGFELGAVPAGTGLVSMRRRAEELGGTLRLESEPGRGTCLELEIPLRSRWTWSGRQRARSRTKPSE